LAALPGARTAHKPQRVLLPAASDTKNRTLIDGISSEIAAVRPRARGQQWSDSPAVRRAIELHAMRAAVEHYTGQGWSVEDVSAFCSYDLHCERSSLAQAGERCLHRLVGREETDHAVGQARSELCAWLTEELAGDGARRKDCPR
jgi:hypothetical protein